MKISGVVVAVVGVVVTVVSLGAAVLRARQNPLVNGQADGSIAGLTVEVHALRLSIEEAAKSQQQVQGVGVYLSVQKDRLLQVMTRLDAARKDTLAAAEQTRAKAQEAKQFEAFAANAATPNAGTSTRLRPRRSKPRPIVSRRSKLTRAPARPWRSRTRRPNRCAGTSSSRGWSR